MMFIHKKEQWLWWIIDNQTIVLFSTDKPQELLLIVKVVKLKLGLNIKHKALVCAF